MDGLDGRYTWDEEADPDEAEFLTGYDSLDYLPDGKTAVAYFDMYDADGEWIGNVGTYVSNLPDGLDTVYRVQVENGRIVDLESGQEVHEAYIGARDG